jgi:hypothetical protein
MILPYVMQHFDKKLPLYICYLFKHRKDAQKQNNRAWHPNCKKLVVLNDRFDDKQH